MKHKDDVLTLIKKRRSVRKFKKHSINKAVVKKIIEAGRWAPSGLNNQPWKFKIVKGKDKDCLAQFTHYKSIIKGADKLILVFLDKNACYNREKDILAIGASIQNMLLYIQESKLGACWLGEIINRKKEIHKFLKFKESLELFAVIALGKPLNYPKPTSRKKLNSLLIN